MFTWHVVYFGKKRDKMGSIPWEIRRYQIRGYRKLLNKLALSNPENERRLTNARDLHAESVVQLCDPKKKMAALASKSDDTQLIDSTQMSDGHSPTTLTSIENTSKQSQLMPNNTSMLHDILTDIGREVKPLNANTIDATDMQSFIYFKLSFKHHFRYETEMLRILFFKNLTYYYQSLSYILIQGGFRVYLSIIVDFFNLSFDSTGNSNTDGGICIFSAVDAINEIICQLFVPCLIYVFLFLFWLSAKVLLKPTKYKMTFYEREPHFTIAFWRSTLLCLGVFLSVALRLIACRKIDEKIFGWRMFYAGGQPCFGVAWFISLFALIFIVVSFSGIYIYLEKLDENVRFDENFRFKTLVRSFKPEMWYWEFVLLSRRILIAALATFAYIDQKSLHVILLSTIAFYLVIQCYYRPFVYPECNIMEVLLLFFALISVSIVDINSNSGNVLGLIVSILILIPACIYCFYLMRIYFVYHKEIKPWQTKFKQETNNHMGMTGINESSPPISENCTRQNSIEINDRQDENMQT